MQKSTKPFLFQYKKKKNDKVGNEDIITISYKIKFIDCAKFMASLLSKLVDNLAERIHKIKCNDYSFF